MRTTKTVSKALTACAAISLSLGLGMGAANAIPPGGASENTPGTSSTVSPHVTPGGVVNFTLTGFPENTQVTVKLDDDGVVHRQTTDSKGNLNGSFVLSNAGSGDHTLRFLATGGGGGKDANGRNKGNTGGRYTNKSPVFTVGESDNGGGNNGASSNNGGSSKGGSDSSSNNNAGSEGSGNNGSEDNGGNSAQDGSSSEQETVYLDADGNPISKEEYDRLNAEADEGGNKDFSDQKNDQNANKGEQKKTASASASSSAKSSASASSSAKTQADSHKTSNTTVTYGQEFPWLGVSVLGVAIIGAIAVLIIRKRP
ncbi:hypothetical protein [Rothia dentocariosa]